MAFLSLEQLEKFGFKSLGKDVLISDKASIYNPEQMTIGDHSRIDNFCVVSGSVNFGKNVHVAIFCNVAEGTAVGAMAVVTNSTERWSIYAGNPARRVKERKKDLLRLERAYLTTDQRW